ncbi:MAG TPA: amidohydrolase family protein [Chthonomonadaceae bacterium]|nr:amidohydrolase family protein [Chthonomonadaceae bacterium]
MKSEFPFRRVWGGLWVAVLVLLLLIAGLMPVWAQDDDPGDDEDLPAAPPVAITAIVGGDVWTVTKGVIKGGTVIIKGSKIDQIGGPELKPPPGAKIVDAKGQVVAPGFIVTSSQIQLTGLTPGNKVKDSLDPFALAIDLALASGVTSAFVTGADGGEGPSNTNAVIKMAEGDTAGMLVAEPVVTTFSMTGGGGRFARFGRASATARWNLRDQLRRAKEYQQKLDAYEADKKAGKKTPEPKKPADADEVLPLIRKERVLRVNASEVADILWALSLVDDFGIKEAISPATEAWMIADQIAKRDVLLIITARSRNAPDERKNGPSGSNPDAPGILQKAGVRFAVLPVDASFSVGGESGRDLLSYPVEAAFAMRGGADAQSALESITLTPAKVLGLEKRLGSLEVGKDADIIVLSGEPLDYRSFVEKTFVNGKLLYDRTRSTFFNQIQPQKGVPTVPSPP